MFFDNIVNEKVYKMTDEYKAILKEIISNLSNDAQGREALQKNISGFDASKIEAFLK